MPALTDACRAGPWPAPACSTCPITTSSTSLALIPARSMAAMMAILPSSWAGRLASAPLNEPTGVRAAETMTMSVMAQVPRRHRWRRKRALASSIGTARNFRKPARGYAASLPLFANRLACAILHCRNSGFAAIAGPASRIWDGRYGRDRRPRRARRHQEVRQPAALQHRVFQLRHPRTPLRDGEAERRLRGLRRQDQRGHHPFGPHPDHLRGGEPAGPKPVADPVPAAADRLLRQLHAGLPALLSRTVAGQLHPAAGAD